MAKVILYKLPSDTNGNILHFYTAADATVDTEASAITNTGAFTDGTVVTYGIEYIYAQVNDAETAMLSPGGTGTVLFGAMPSDNAQVLIKSTAVGLATGNNDDIDNIAASNFVRITGPTGAFAVRGIADGVDGVTLSLFNDTAETMTISDENAGSVAANRIITTDGADQAFAGNAIVTLTYSGEKLRWVMTSVSELPAGVGTGSVTSVSVVTANGVSGSVATATTTPAITLTVQNAVADGATKGIAAFTAADFDAAAGVISIDYTNGQAASGATKGFLTAADWTTFNGKISAKENVGGSASGAAVAASRFLQPAGLNTVNAATAAIGHAYPVSFAGTVSRLFIIGDAVAVGSNVVTVYKNGVATALTVTLGAGLATGSDLVNTFTVVAGDYLHLGTGALDDESALAWGFQIAAS